MRMGKPYDLVFTTKIVAVLTFLFTGRKKSVFLYTFAIYQLADNRYDIYKNKDIKRFFRNINMFLKE